MINDETGAAKIEIDGYTALIRFKKVGEEYQPDITIVRDVLHSVTTIPSPRVRKTFTNKDAAINYGLACAKDYIEKRLK